MFGTSSKRQKTDLMFAENYCYIWRLECLLRKRMFFELKLYCVLTNRHLTKCGSRCFKTSIKFCFIFIFAFYILTFVEIQMALTVAVTLHIKFTYLRRFIVSLNVSLFGVTLKQTLVLLHLANMWENCLSGLQCYSKAFIQHASDRQLSALQHANSCNSHHVL